ncbi:protein FAM169B isoform X4 [Aotus nancymaae]|uniref:protein FAM169B isoform X4 n=1 Tax=Aotus nancymaae TaxID=37293 RepID=UPI0030FE735C
MKPEAACGAAAGVYPVDVLDDDPDTHRKAALACYTALGEGAGASSEVFCLPTGEQVKLEASSVCFCTVHRDEPQHKILVLVNPQDTKTVVAVYLKESWWSTEDAIRTSDPAREGLMKVQSFGERIVLFILNVIIFGRLERNLDDDDMFFLPHSVKEQAKILWRHGAAVGFYTTKMKGSLCGSGTGVCYLLPVFDTVFVRRKHRRQGLGMAMLRDFCETFPDDEALGVSYPMSSAMYQGAEMRAPHQEEPGDGCVHVCRQFLLVCPEERGRLWEVKPPGAWGQRINIWLKVQLQPRLPDCSYKLVCEKLDEWLLTKCCFNPLSASQPRHQPTDLSPLLCPYSAGSSQKERHLLSIIKRSECKAGCLAGSSDAHTPSPRWELTHTPLPSLGARAPPPTLRGACTHTREPK